MTAEVRIYETIGADWFGAGITAKTISARLDQIPASEHVVVRINSLGGDAFEGLAIFNLLRERGVDVVIDAVAASAASVIAAAGRKVSIAENGLVMVHNPWGLAMGEAGDMRKMAESLDKITGSIVTSYAARSTLSRDELATLMAAETWFDANEAIDTGLVDEIDRSAAAPIENFARAWIRNGPCAANSARAALARLHRNPVPANSARPTPAASLTPEDEWESDVWLRREFGNDKERWLAYANRRTARRAL